MNYLLPSGELFYDLQDGRGLLLPSGIIVGSTESESTYTPTTLFAMPGNPTGEAIYDGTTKVTGSSSSQAWSSAVTLAGRAGGVTIGITNSTYFSAAYSSITSPYHTTRYYVNPALVSLPSDGDTCYVHLAFSPLSVNASSYTALYNDGGTIKLWSRVRNDADAVISGSFQTIPGGFASIEWIEERLYKSSGSATFDGKKEVYLNGVLVSTISAQLLWNVFAYDTSRFGATIGGTCTGTLELGQINVTNTVGPIGPLPDSSVNLFNIMRRRRRFSQQK